MSAKHYLNYNPEAVPTGDDVSVRKYSSSTPGGMGNSNNTTLSRIFSHAQSHLKVSQNVIKDQFNSGQSDLINTGRQNTKPDFPNGNVTFNFAGASQGNNIKTGVAEIGRGLEPPELSLKLDAPNPSLENTTRKYHPDLSFPSRVNLSSPELPPEGAETAGITTNPDKGYGSNGQPDVHIRINDVPGEQKIDKLYADDEVMHS